MTTLCYNKNSYVIEHNTIIGSSAVEISERIEAAIREGRLDSGEQLPTVRSLAERSRVSPATVAGAYRRLRERGLVLTAGRRGTCVSPQPPVSVSGIPAPPPHVRNLAFGNPDPELLPSLGRALARIDPPKRLYAEEASLPELLELARREFFAERVPTESLAVVAGALDGIERVLEAHLRRGDRVAIEDPAFSAVRDLLPALGLVPVPVAIDERGLLPRALERALESGARAVIVTPRAQNPTGAALEPRRVSELRRVLLAYPDVLIVEDDHAGPVAGAPALTLVGKKRASWAVVCSVSKSLGPDLRVAVLAADRETLARVEGRQLLGIRWVSHVLQRLVVVLWNERGMRARLRRAAEAYSRRREALIGALAGHGIPAQGRSALNVWVGVPEEARLISQLMDEGWAVTPGERYRLETPPALRITTAALEPAEARELAGTLARLMGPAGRTVAGPS